VAERESRTAAIVAAAVAAVYVAVAAAHGALGVARNDDWAYYNVAFRFARSGTVSLDGWVQALFVGQGVGAWPVVKLFGEEFAPLQLGVATLAAVGLWASYLLVRSFLPWHYSALSIGCLAVGPMYGTLSVSFMTDVPAFSLQMLALVAAARALRTERISWRWLTGALLLSFLAFSIREYAVASGLAIGLATGGVVWQRQRSSVVRLVALLAAWSLAVLVLFWWRSGLVDSYDTHLELGLQGALGAGRAAARGAMTLGLMIAPALLALSPARVAILSWQRSRVWSVGVVGACGAVAVSAHDFLGNYFVNGASYGATLAGGGPALVPGWVWFILQALGVLGLAVLGALIVVRLHDARREGTPALLTKAPIEPGHTLALAFVSIAAALPLAAALLTDAPLFDRYLLPLAPLVAALAMRSARSLDVMAARSVRISVGAFVVLAALGLLAVDASATFDGAKWRLAVTVERQGVAAATIDGGYEWFGFHQKDVVQPMLAESDATPWVRMFSRRPVCVVNFQTITVTDTDGLVDGEIARLTAHTLLGVEYLLIAVAADPVCGPVTP
jgi:uncharacterized membrane protein YhaH (DUF805 family)